jgi:hypothetical protein
MKMKILVLFFALFACVLPSNVFANDEVLEIVDEVESIVNEIEIDEEVQDVLEQLEGVELEEITEIPSRFNVFWRGVKERVSLFTTFDPVKKAEKRLIFAEERMNIAKIIAEKSDDPKVQERAEKMVERANGFMEKVEEDKDKWIDNTSARAKKLMQNIAIHQVRKEKIFDKLEEKLPEEALDRLSKIRERSLEKGNDLLEKFSEKDIPEEMKKRIKETKEFIKERHVWVKENVAERKVILDKIKDGEEGAKEELKEFRENRIEELKERKEDRREKIIEKKMGIEDIIKDNNDSAKAEDTISEIQRVERREIIREDVKEHIQEVRKEIREHVREDETVSINRREVIKEIGVVEKTDEEDNAITRRAEEPKIPAEPRRIELKAKF